MNNILSTSEQDKLFIIIVVFMSILVSTSDLPMHLKEGEYSLLIPIGWSFRISYLFLSQTILRFFKG